MKRIALVLAVLGLAGCSKGNDTPATPPAATSTAPADTTHGMMMGDTSKHMMMGDSSHMNMSDTTKK